MPPVNPFLSGGAFHSVFFEQFPDFPAVIQGEQPPALYAAQDSLEFLMNEDQTVAIPMHIGRVHEKEIILTIVNSDNPGSFSYQ